MMQHFAGPPAAFPLAFRSCSMQRRTLLKLGLVSTAVLAVAGVVTLRPSFADGHLTEPAKRVMHAVARAVLDGSLPADAMAREATLTAHLARLDATIAGFPATVQGEVSQLLMLLGGTAGRRALANLAPSWEAATVAELQAALQDMRVSRMALRQQAYHALRDLTNAAYYADASVWPLLGYPGPRAI